MNTKSKIFLVLALVLSVTACSKGGGGGSKFISKPSSNNNPPDTSKIPEKPIVKPDSTNTLKLRTAIYGSNESPSSLKTYAANLVGGKTLTDYDYLQIPAPGLIDKKDEFVFLGSKKYRLPNDMAPETKNKRYINKANTMMIGNVGGDLYRVQTTRGNYDHGNFNISDGQHTYEGKALLSLNNKEPIALDITMNPTFKSQQNEVVIIGHLSPNDSAYKATLNATVNTGVRPYVLNGTITSDPGSGLSYDDGTLDGEFIDSSASGFIGSFGSQQADMLGVYMMDLIN